METAIEWDSGSAYELLFSLAVLHHPDTFGVRPAWAAGMRSRLPKPTRETLERAAPITIPALAWVASLPAPRDCAAALAALTRIAPAERLAALLLPGLNDPEWETLFRALAARGAWDQADLRAAQTLLPLKRHAADEQLDLAAIFDLWADAEGFGAALLAALRTYYEVFFAEEEPRIAPALTAALNHARAMAQRLPLPDLLEELSRGVAFELPAEVTRILLVPSYWATPIVVMTGLGRERMLVSFGARPLGAALEPGAAPDALVGVFKALADPTRLSILRYLAAEPLTPTQLGRRLRLRTATVSHHLKILRLAELVRVRISAGVERVYAARPEALPATFDALRAFIADREA